MIYMNEVSGGRSFHRLSRGTAEGASTIDPHSIHAQVTGDVLNLSKYGTRLLNYLSLQSSMGVLRGTTIH